MKNFIIALLAALVFIPFLGRVHLFDWDEINFAESAREMIVSHDYSTVQIAYRPFWEKPPLFIWMEAASMKLFGVNAFAARFPNAIIGIITLLVIFNIGRRLMDERFGLWWTLIYAGSWLPFFYFKSGIIDPAFNLFIFLAIYFIYRAAFSKHSNREAVCSGVFLGLAVLTKGPVAILISLLALIVYWLYNKGKIALKWRHLGLVALFTALLTGLWFGYIIITRGWWLVQEFIQYQVRLFSTPDAGHGGPFYYHWVVLLIGCFPASAFLFVYFQTARQKSIYLYQSQEMKEFRNWMWILFWVVLILFSIVKTKIIHYSSLCYFPLTFLAAVQVYRMIEGKITLKRWVFVLLGATGLLIALAIAALPLVGIYKERLIPYIEDPFAVGNLRANVSWSFAECAYGIIYALVILGSVVAFYRRRFRRGLVVLLTVQVVMMELSLFHFVPKIEAYSQRAAIEFFRSLEGKDVYVQVLGYKSYAQYFYSKMPLPHNPNYYNTDWLLNGKIDKPAYFACKNISADYYRGNPHLKEVGEKNGFVFFERQP